MEDPLYKDPMAELYNNVQKEVKRNHQSFFEEGTQIEPEYRDDIING